MPEFFINVKETGAKKSKEAINKLTDAMGELGNSFELNSKKVKPFKKQLAELSKTADKLNKKLDELIKKKELLK